uniref:Uncharacterized protein n=1 Tax=Ixodes ricinus TaxID=34613 RepID=A0A6B0ULF6_IXORI
MTIIKKKKVVQQVHCSQEPALYVHAHTHMQTHSPRRRRMYIMDTQNVHIVFFFSRSSLTPSPRVPMIQTRLSHFKTYVHSHIHTHIHPYTFVLHSRPHEWHRSPRRTRKKWKKSV